MGTGVKAADSQADVKTKKPSANKIRKVNMNILSNFLKSKVKKKVLWNRMKTTNVPIQGKWQWLSIILSRLN